LLVLNAARNDKEIVRCGFITGKKVGKAVSRNRARRLIQEVVRLRLPSLQPGWDLVWIARASMANAEFSDVAGAVDDLLKRARLLQSGALETAQLQ
jgi:ribonuclease P protein component